MREPLRKPLSLNYRYNWNVGMDNHMFIQGIPEGYSGNMIEMEMNILSRWIWGIGMSLNKIVNAVGFLIKSQDEKDYSCRYGDNDCIEVSLKKSWTVFFVISFYNRILKF